MESVKDLDNWFGAQLRGNRRWSLSHQIPKLRKIIHALTGYYYHFGPALGRSYLPKSAVPSELTCAVCGSQLLRRTFEYFGTSQATDYQTRTQLICPRCLVTRDWCREHERSVQVEFHSTAKQAKVIVKYKNNSEISQFIFGFILAVDPQNASVNIAPDLYRELLSGVEFSPRGIGPRWLGPNQTFDFEFHVSGINEELFYLLIEVHLFINFSWNWLSFNIRRPRIERWLADENYRAVLPKERA